MPRQLRIREFRSRTAFEGVQRVQEKRWFGWRTIEEFEVPSHVIISLGAVGDTGGWVSPVVAKYGTWDKNGIITPNKKAA